MIRRLQDYKIKIFQFLNLLIFISGLIFFSYVCGVFAASVSEIYQEVDRRMEADFNSLVQWARWAKEENTKFAEMMRRRNVDMEKIRQDEGEFTDALEIQYPHTEYQRSVKKLSSSEVRRRMEDFESRKDQVKRRTDSDILTYQEFLSQRMEIFTQSRNRFEEKAMGEQNQYPQWMKMTYSNEPKIFQERFSWWRDRVEKEIDPSIKEIRGTFSDVRMTLVSKEDKLDTIANEMQKRNRDDKIERIITKREDDQKREMEKEETRRREAEFERVIQKETSALDPELQDAKKRLTEAEEKTRDAIAETEKEKSALEKAPDTKKKSSMEDAMGY